MAFYDVNNVEHVHNTDNGNIEKPHSDQEQRTRTHAPDEAPLEEPPGWQNPFTTQHLSNPEPEQKLGRLERMFDCHHKGAYLKRLLICMLILAGIAQLPSIVYTAYDEHWPSLAEWYKWIPALAVVFFIILDWTILPICYHFAQTRKPSLKIILFVLLGAVGFGAFEGYLTSTERLMNMRLKEINHARLDVDQAKDKLDHLTVTRDDLVKRQNDERAQRAPQRQNYEDQIRAKNSQIATTQQGLSDNDNLHATIIAQIKDNCKLTPSGDKCMVTKMDAEENRYKDKRYSLDKQIEDYRAELVHLNKALETLNAADGTKVDISDKEVKDAQDDLDKKKIELLNEVLTNQVYRWAGVFLGNSPRDVSAEEANRVLLIFAGAVAASFILVQIILSVSYYGLGNLSFTERHKISFLGYVARVSRARRAYYARKRKPLWRERTVKENVYLRGPERIKIITLPVPPGTPIPEGGFPDIVQEVPPIPGEKPTEKPPENSHDASYVDSREESSKKLNGQANV